MLTFANANQSGRVIPFMRLLFEGGPMPDGREMRQSLTKRKSKGKANRGRRRRSKGRLGWIDAGKWAPQIPD